MEKNYIIALMDLMFGLSDSEMRRCFEMDIEELEYQYKMLYLEKEEEIIEDTVFATTLPSKDTEHFYRNI